MFGYGLIIAPKAHAEVGAEDSLVVIKRNMADARSQDDGHVRAAINTDDE